MKKLLCAFFLIVFTQLACAQITEYWFKIENIENYSVAKPVIATLRQHYNNENNPRGFMPTFNEEKMTFFVTTDVSFSKDEFITYLSGEGYVVTEFSFSTTQNEEHYEKD